MISRFVHHVVINEDTVAVFNSLLNEIIYISNNEWEDIKGGKIDNSFRLILQEKGIIVKDKSVDDEALALLRSKFNDMSGNISILYLIVSSVCNLQCKYCFIEEASYSDHTKDNIMAENTALTALQKYIRYIEEKNIDIRRTPC